MSNDNRQTYTLNCEKCKAPYESTEGFPKPQLCFKCKFGIADLPDEPLIMGVDLASGPDLSVVDGKVVENG